MKGAGIMKKDRAKKRRLWVNLVIGAVFLALSAVLHLLAPRIAGGRLMQFLEGAGSGAFGVGIVNLGYFIYWIMPSRREEYREMEENAEIEGRDERKRMLRDRAGRYAYLAGLCICVLGAGVFMVLYKLEIAPWGGIVCDCLMVMLAVQIVLGVAIYQYLNKKY